MKKLAKKYIEALEYYKQNPTKSKTEISKIFNCNRHTFANHENDYFKYTIESADKKDKDYMFYFTDEELKIVNNYVNNPTYLAKIKIDSRKLKNWLRILGYDYNTKYKYSYNRNLFNEIKTEEDAYWLGFLLADGYIYEYGLNFKLAEKDKQHVYKFAKYAGFTKNEIEEVVKISTGGAYTKDNICYGISLSCKQISKNLHKYNLFQRKSGKEIPYKCSSIELEKAYIRGIIDGDGWIRKTQYGFGVCGSKEVLQYIKNFINENIISTETNSIYKDESSNIYRFTISGKNKVSKILSFFYTDASIYLDRKYNIFKNNYCHV